MSAYKEKQRAEGRRQRVLMEEGKKNFSRGFKAIGVNLSLGEWIRSYKTLVCLLGLTTNQGLWNPRRRVLFL